MNKLFVLIALIVFSISFTSASLWDNIAYWNMQNQSGIIYDLTGNNFNMTVSGICDVDGILGVGLKQNANCFANHSVKAQSLALGTGSNTISFWTRDYAGSNGANRFLIDFGSNETAGFGNKGSVFVKNITNALEGWGNFFGTNDTQLSAENLPIGLNTWTHYVQVRNGDRVQLYKNGVLQNYVSGFSQNMSPSKSYITVFKRGAVFLNSSLSEVGIWNRNLSATEILQLYNSGTGILFNSPIVTLNSPANNSISLDGIFNSSGQAVISNFTNATLFVWSSTNILVINQTNNVTGLTNTTIWNIANNLSAGTYKWNAQWCTQNTTSGSCVLAYSNFSFFSGVGVNSDSYNSTTYETSREGFISNLTIGSGLTVSSALLYYANQSYIGTISNTGTNYILSRSIDIPLGNTTNQWFWSLVTSSGNLNLTVNSQTVAPINLSACTTAPQNVAFFNFSMKEEGTLLPINASIESVYSYWLGYGTINKTMLFSNTTDGKQNYGFCFSPPDRTIFLSGINTYYKTGYDLRTFYFSNTSKTNSSGNIDLFLLSTATSDVVTFTVIDDFLSPVANAEIRILRWDLVSDTFYLVNTIITDSNGQASSNLRLNDAFYIYMVSYQGTLYLTTTSSVQVGTTKTLQIFIHGTSNIYTIFKNIQKSLIFTNTTNITSLTYTDPSNSISGMCVIVKKSTGVGTEIVTQSCSTSTSGVIAIDLTPYGNGAYTVDARASYNTGTSIIYYIIDSISFTIGVGARFLVIGRAAQVISMVFIGTMAMIGVATGSIPLGIILVVAAFIVLFLFGFVNFTSGFITTIVAMLVLISMSLQRRYS